MRRRALLLGGAAAGLSACSGAGGATDPSSSASSPPPRVATLDAQRTEDLLSLGLSPVAAVEAAAYRAAAPRLSLSNGIPDAGTTGSYTLDVLQKSRPQLLVGTDTVVPVADRDALSAITTLQLDRGVRAGTALADVRQAIDELGRATGRETRAQALLDALNTQVSLTREALVGRVNEPIALVALQEGRPGAISLFTASSAIGSLADQVGVVNVDKGLGDTVAPGTRATDLSALSSAGRILWWSTPASRRSMSALSSNATWKALPAVRDKQVFPMLQGWSPWGGIGSVTAFCTQLATLFGAKATPTPTPSKR